MISTTIHDQLYDVYSWEDFGKSVFQLSSKIAASTNIFDRVIALAKGGVTIARPLLDQIGIKEMGSIQIEFYTGIGETNKTPVITQSLPISIKNERILIIDDIADSGETLRLAKPYILQHGGIEVKTAALAIKPWTTFMPDFYADETKAWIIWPWEKGETYLILKGLWEQRGDSPGEITQQLTKLGYTAEEIEVFQQN